MAALYCVACGGAEGAGIDSVPHGADLSAVGGPVACATPSKPTDGAAGHSSVSPVGHEARPTRCDVPAADEERPLVAPPVAAGLIDALEVPEQAPHPCDEAHPIGINVSSAPSIDDSAWFATVPAHDWAIDRAALTVSAGDIDGDGRADLVVGSVEPQLLVNCGEQGFRALALPGPVWARSSASYMLDVDSDGLTDLLIGGPSGSVWLIRQTAPWEFEGELAVELHAETPAFAVSSFGVQSDRIHLGVNRFPADVTVAAMSVDAKNFEANRAPNAWLQIDPGSSAPLQPWAPDVDAESESCWHAPTYVASFLPRHQWGQDDLFYVGNDFGPDCLASATGGAAGAYPPAPGGEALGETLATMGADFHFEGESIAMITSDFVRDPHLWVIGPDGTVVEQEDRLVFANSFGYKITWGVAQEDFDGDGHRDALIAHAGLAFDDYSKETELNWFLKSVDPGGLHVLAGQPDGTMVEDTGLVPALPEGSGYYSVVVADVLGGDGYGDGCPDVLLTPMVSMPHELLPHHEPLNYLGEVQLLRCMKARDFVGVRLSRSLDATRAAVELELADGTSRWEPVRTSAHLGASRDSVAAFTLGEGEQPVRMKVVLGDGEPVIIDAPAVGSYTVVDVP